MPLCGCIKGVSVSLKVKERLRLVGLSLSAEASEPLRRGSELCSASSSPTVINIFEMSRVRLLFLIQMESLVCKNHPRF